MLTASTNLSGIGRNITDINYNNINMNKPNLADYPLKTNVDASLNTINNTLSNKQNIFTCIHH